MSGSARLTATIAAPLGLSSADAPKVLHWPGRRLLVQRGDTELVTLDLSVAGEGPTPEVRFPAPWPRQFGTATVSPHQNAAVFAGVHEVRLVETTGATRWRVPHGCWAGLCSSPTDSGSPQHVDNTAHAHADSGSAAFSSDGEFLWAHIIGPLGDAPNPDVDEASELWVILDARSGRLLGRAETMTTASSSEHTPHPDPTQMGLSVGEGEEGSPLLWGRWNGQEMTTHRLGIERILLDVSPAGRRLLTVPVGQWSLALFDAQNGSTLRKLDAAGTVPNHPLSTGNSRVYWDYEGAFVDEDTIIAGTSECDASYGSVRHWVINADQMALSAEVDYPFPAWGPARSAGAGTWYTVSKDGATVHLWSLAQE